MGGELGGPGGEAPGLGHSVQGGSGGLAPSLGHGLKECWLLCTSGCYVPAAMYHCFGLYVPL